MMHRHKVHMAFSIDTDSHVTFSANYSFLVYCED